MKDRKKEGRDEISDMGEETKGGGYNKRGKRAATEEKEEDGKKR